MTPVTLAAAGGHGGASAATVGPLRATLIVVLLAIGTFFLAVGTIGLLRLPNVYNRMHATTKATTLGATSVALAGFVYFGPGGDGLVTLVTILFLYLTAPTGAHMISRSAARMDVGFLEDVTWPRDAGPGPNGVESEADASAGDDADGGSGGDADGAAPSDD